MDFWTLWKHCYNSLVLLFTKYKCTWLPRTNVRISMSLSRCITCHDVFVQQSHTTKRLLPWCKVNFWRFVAMLLLRSKDQQQNNPLATFATHLCRQRKVHEWTASSSLMWSSSHQWYYICEPDSCAVWVSYRQKKLSLQESNQLIGIKIPTLGFSRNIWFLIPISRREMPVLHLLRTPMRLLTVLYQVPQTRPAHLMKRRNVFD